LRFSATAATLLHGVQFTQTSNGLARFYPFAGKGFAGGPPHVQPCHLHHGVEPGPLITAFGTPIFQIGREIL
jgi:hypothetical protein